MPGWRVEAHDGFYAEIEPAASAWLPLPGRMSRWWFEVFGPGDDPDGYETHYHTLDGGAFSLRRCLHRADQAAFDAWAKWRRTQAGEVPDARRP